MAKLLAMQTVNDFSATTGCVALNKFLTGESGRTQSWLARALGVSQSAVSVWTKGRSRPSLVYAYAIEILAGIPMEWWTTETERNWIAEMPAIAKDAQTTGRVRAVDPRQMTIPGTATEAPSEEVDDVKTEVEVEVTVDSAEMVGT